MDRLVKILSKLKHLDLGGDIEQKESVQAGFGGTCDVFVGWSKRHNKKVAIKRIRVFLRKDEKFAKKLAREIRVWASLEHERVLPFLGYFVEGKDAMPSLVSLWMANGTLDDYMEDFPRGGEDTKSMLAGIAQGLNYLHSQEVMHADLKGKNILVSDNNKPLLADFGLSIALTYTKNGTTSMADSGTVRWMAIELFDCERPVHTSATDVWAFGMVAYELLSGNIPYNDKSDHRVPSLILEGKLPDKPENEGDFPLFDPLWQICQLCWNKIPADRPTALQLYEGLTEMAEVNPELASELDDGGNVNASDFNDDNVKNLGQFAIDDSPSAAVMEMNFDSRTLSQVMLSEEYTSPTNTIVSDPQTPRPRALYPTNESSTTQTKAKAQTGVLAVSNDVTSSEARAQPVAGKRMFKDIVRNVMLIRQSATEISHAPIRQRTVSSTVLATGTDGSRSTSESTLSNLNVRIPSLIPALKSMAPQLYMQPHTALVRHLQFSPNGEYLATCSWDRTCAIFRVKDFGMEPRVLGHPQGFVGQVAWSPQSDLLLTKMARGMKLWVPQSGVLRKNIDRKCFVQSVAWFPQGEAFLSVEGGEVTKLDLTGKILDTYHFDRMTIHDVAVTSDQERMVCVATLTASPTGLKPSMSREEKQIIVYNLNDKDIENQVPVLHEVRDITLTKDGNFALVSYERKAPPQLWKLDLLRDRNEEGAWSSRLSLIHTYMPKGSVDFVGSSYFGGEDDQLVLCAGKAGDVHIWDRKSALELHQFKAHGRHGRHGSNSNLTCTALSPAATPLMFVAGSHDGTVVVWTSSPIPPIVISSSYLDLRHSGASTPARTITPPPQVLAPDAPRTESPTGHLDEREGRREDQLSYFLAPPPRERSEERRSGITFQSLLNVNLPRT